MVSVKRSRRCQIFGVPPKDDGRRLSSGANRITKGLHGPESLTRGAKNRNHAGSSQPLDEQIQCGAEEDLVIGNPWTANGANASSNIACTDLAIQP